jgi:U3 small nucleolar RNA-associated protein 10
VCTKDKKREFSGDIIKELRESANMILKTITGWMSASTYFRGITQLLDYSDNLVKRKVLFCQIELFFIGCVVPFN